MLKRLKLTSVIASSLLLFILGFGSYEARGQDDVACPGITSSTGWLNLLVGADADITIGLLGTIETFNGKNVAGIDWLYSDDEFINFPETTSVGSQLVSWWSQSKGRSTFIQVTNIDDGTFGPNGINLEVKIIDGTTNNCVELRDFSDFLTKNDTVIYDLSNLVSNKGQKIDVSNIQGKEGFIVISAVNPVDGAAISFNFLEGSMRMVNADSINEYGVNVFAREADTFNATTGTCSVSATACLSDANCPSPEICNGSTCPELTFPNVTPNCSYEQIFPSNMAQNFSILKSGDKAAADLVLIDYIDDYGPPYDLFGGFAFVTHTNLFDDLENRQSCGGFDGCFVRLGIDDTIGNSDGFSPIITPAPTPSPTPSPTPKACFQNVECTAPAVCVGSKAGTCSTTTSRSCFTDNTCPAGETCNGEVAGTCQVPTTPTPTPRRSPGPPSSSGSGCSIGGPVEIGTAMANVLVPLVPAFAIGFRVLRRRSRKNQK